MAAVVGAGFRALAPDMRGYGGSDAPAAHTQYTPFQTVGDLVGRLHHFGLPDCVVVGHDLGANVAWNAAMMRPDRFRAVFGLSVPFQPTPNATVMEASASPPPSPSRRPAVTGFRSAAHAGRFAHR